ncbi:MAG: hypothetical protein HUU08_17785 [Candidatus Brocadia sp.]|nr:hypothetical protein [Candidatus Brocadia sp.]UJS17579.1 MAG: hypothetical protein L3J17_00595 [Candidatus Jettenia sp.]
MSKYLLDTNIISFYLKGDERLKEKISCNIDLLATSIISYYEIVSGLQSINANKRINEFKMFCGIVDELDRDDYQFHRPVKSVKDIEILGQIGWRVRTTVLRQL